MIRSEERADPACEWAIHAAEKDESARDRMAKRADECAFTGVCEKTFTT